MSEFLAEARIVVRPDTTAFRGLLEAELRAVMAKPIMVPVVPVVATGIAAATAQTAAFTTAQTAAAAQTQGLAVAMEKEAIAATRATAATNAHTRSLSQLARGAGASGLTLFGLRGATLAASGAFLAGTAAVVAFSKAVASAARLETELNVFRVAAGATADEMERAAAEAQALGRDITLPGVTAGKAAEAMTQLAKAGLSVRDSLDATRGTLQLATAAQIDNVAATNLVASALNSFGLAGGEAIRVADLLTGAAKESQGEITDMGTALQQASAVAKLAGISIEDTVTFLTELARAGISGGRAGTSLRVAILRLINPTELAAKKLKELNVQIRDSQGRVRSQVFTDIAAALGSMEKAQAQATLATIFGSDAIRAAAIIGEQGVVSFRQLRDSVTEAGLAQEQAAARTSGLAGAAENLKNQAAGLGLAIGEFFKGPSTDFLNVLSEGIKNYAIMFEWLGKVSEQQKKTTKTWAELTDMAGRFNRVNAQSSTHSEKFLKTLEELNKALVDQRPKGIAAADAIEGYRIEVLLASQALDGLNHRLDESFDRFASVPRQAATGLNVKQVENIIGGFDAQEVRAKISGDNTKLLDVLNTEQEFFEKQLERDYVRRRPALKRSIELALLGTVNEIEAVQSKAAAGVDRVRREAEQAARDAAAAASAREQALLAQFGLARDQQANRIAAAAQTKGLQDDIKRQHQLKALVLAQIGAVRERISIEGGRKAAIVALQTILGQVRASLADLARQQQEAQADQRQALLQGIWLDIDLAQITGNQAAEVKARNRKIAELNKDLAAEAKAHGKTTVAYKKIRNEIAAQNAALKEIRQERQKGQSFAQATFEFLQAQQGFASNLMGNLIPRGATSGLVGGVQGALTPVAGAAEARSQSGITAGQGNATNSLLVQILNQLKEMNGETKAPEARKQRAHSWSLMDGVGGG